MGTKRTSMGRLGLYVFEDKQPLRVVGKWKAGEGGGCRIRRHTIFKEGWERRSQRLPRVMVGPLRLATSIVHRNPIHDIFFTSRLLSSWSSYCNTSGCQFCRRSKDETLQRLPTTPVLSAARTAVTTTGSHGCSSSLTLGCEVLCPRGGIVSLIQSML
jgi:hypothetical protein